jgi:3-methyladenine DNA glycosylase AlkD
MRELEGYGNEGTKKVFMKHGAREPVFGVKVQDLKKIQKKIKKDYRLALELFATGNSDAMYFAGLIADETQMTKADIETWVQGAYWYYLCEYTVPQVAAETDYGFELALKWIDSVSEQVASAGWSTLTFLSSLREDADLNLEAYSSLLERAVKELPEAQNRVRYTMNGFVIAAGCNIASLTGKATACAQEIGKVSVDMAGTSCKVPLATQYIQKVVARGTVGKKRKTYRK